ncbi:MAG: chloride channel protein, partial [Myxococcales bacterium]|nr:chloride channel protein [Myxococcales bacterium]
ENGGAYGMVGMGAVAAAVTHAPITAVLMLFEMTRNYQIILPLMLTLAVAGLVAATMESESLYLTQLKLRGVKMERGREDLVMYDLRVADVMRREGFDTLETTAAFTELTERFLHHRVNEVYVLDADGRYHGLVELQDVKVLMVNPRPDLAISDVETREVPSLTPGQPLADA